MSKPQKTGDSNWVIWSPDAEDYLSRTVIEKDPEWSGLYDAKGNKLFKEKDPIGFIRRSKDG